MDVTLPNGDVIRGVPDGTSKADLVAKLRAAGHDLSWLEPPAPAAPVSQTAAQTAAPADATSAGIGVGPEVGVEETHDTRNLFKRSGARLVKGATEIPSGMAYMAGAIAGGAEPGASVAPESAFGAGLTDRRPERAPKSDGFLSGLNEGILGSDWNPKTQAAYTDDELAKAQAEYDRTHAGETFVDRVQNKVSHEAGSAVAEFAAPVTETQMAQDVRQWAKSKEDEAVAALSPQVRRALELSIVESDEEGGLHVGEGATNPDWWLANLIDVGVQVAPSLGTTAVASRMSYMAGVRQALEKAATQKVPQSVALRYAQRQGIEAAKRSAVIVGGLTEGGTAAGQDAAQVREAIESLTEEQLMSYPDYMEFRDEGMTHEQARAKVVRDHAAATAIAAGTLVGLTGAPMNAFFGKVTAQMGRVAKPAASKLRQVGTSIAGEAGQEFVQEGGEGLITNKYSQKPGEDIWQGVLEQAITGAVLGGVVGGGVTGLEVSVPVKKEAAKPAAPAKPGTPPPPPPAAPPPLTPVQIAEDKFTKTASALADVLTAARDPHTPVKYADVQAARDAHKQSIVDYTRELLHAGAIKPADQPAVAEALKQAEAAGVSSAGAVGGPASSKRDAALEAVATAQQLEAADAHDLVANKLANLSPTGSLVLTPEGRRQRKAAQDRAKAESGPAATKTAEPAKSVAQGTQAKPAAKSKKAKLKLPAERREIAMQKEARRAEQQIARKKEQKEAIAANKAADEVASKDELKAKVQATAADQAQLSAEMEAQGLDSKNPQMREAFERAAKPPSNKQPRGKNIPTVYPPGSGPKQSGAKSQIPTLKAAPEGTKLAPAEDVKPVVPTVNPPPVTTLKGIANMPDRGALAGALRQEAEDLLSRVGSDNPPSKGDIQTVIDRARRAQGQGHARAAFSVKAKNIPGAPKRGATVNIGLNTNDGGTITADEAVKALEKHGVKVERKATRQSGTEPTLVASLDRELTPAEADAVSKALKQDAIAQLTPTEGALHGPAKDKWGAFNPDYFLTHSGKAASKLSGKKHKFKHFSNLSDDTVVLDPEKMGTGTKGAEAKRAGPKVTSLYAEGAEVEPDVSTGRQRYDVEVADEDIYDGSADPEGLLAQAQVPYGLTQDAQGNMVPVGHRFDMTKFEQLVRDAGYLGYHLPDAQGILKGQGRLFHKQQATKYVRPEDRPTVALRAKAKAPEVIGPKEAKVRALLTPEENARLKKNSAKKLIELFDELPDGAELAASALAGQAKRGWYRRSAEAISNVFGPDAPRFAALLAALSPQTSVEWNFRNAVAAWVGWDKAGRPQGREEIIKILRQHLFPSANRVNESNILPAWINNTVRALTAEDPSAVILSGPKVDSFAANLRGETERVTLDAWMANWGGVKQTMFSGSMNKAGTSPGMRPGYLAYAARVREAAAILTERTGETWTPAEVQETVWSWAKTLYEQAEGYGALATAREILDNKELTDELINATPDFAGQFEDPEVASSLAGTIYGPRAARSAGEAAAARRAGGEATPTSDEDAQRLRKAADRLDALREKRRADKAKGKKVEAVDADIAFRVKALLGTAKFKAWFGNSKVVEPDGSPKRLYHGTFGDFGAFNMDTANEIAYVGPGFYFTDSPQDASENYASEGGADVSYKIGNAYSEVAEGDEYRNERDQIAARRRELDAKLNAADANGTYKTVRLEVAAEMKALNAAETALSDRTERQARAKIGHVNEGSVLPVFMRMENPFYIGGLREFRVYETEGEQLAGELDDLGKDYAANKVRERIKVDGSMSGEQFMDILKYEQTDDAKAIEIVLSALGYDGIIDAGANRWHFTPYGATHYITWESTNVKSAVGNNGEYSRENPDIAQRVGPGSNTGLPEADMQEVAQRVEQELGVKTNVADSQEDLPDHIQELIPDGVQVTGMFVTYPATGESEIWYVRSNIDSKDEAYETGLHEAVGHKGLRALLGKNYHKVMSALRKSFPAQVAAAGRRNEIDKDIAKAKARGDFATVKRLESLEAEEMVAYATGRVLAKRGGASKLSVWKKVIAKVRDILRGLGLLNKYNEQDIEALIYRARDFLVKKSAKARAQEIVYQGKIAAAVKKQPDGAPQWLSPDEYLEDDFDSLRAERDEEYEANVRYNEKGSPEGYKTVNAFTDEEVRKLKVDEKTRESMRQEQITFPDDFEEAISGEIDGAADVEAHADGQRIGYVTMGEVTDDGWTATYVYVNPRYRNTGVAQRMYKAISKRLGVPAVPARTQTPYGRGMWKSFKRRKVAFRLKNRPYINTPQFKEWFGDSKIVDENGEPKVVFHGTRSPTDFDAFDTKVTGRSGGRELGSHFGEHAAAEERALMSFGMPTKEERNIRLIPVYLSIKNPLRLKDEGQWGFNDLRYQLANAGVDIKDVVAADYTAVGMGPQEIDERMKAAIIRAGFDGVVYENKYEGKRKRTPAEVADKMTRLRIEEDPTAGGHGGKSKLWYGVVDGEGVGSVYDMSGTMPMAEVEATIRESAANYLAANSVIPTDSYIAFHPEQIKSAVGNNGEFSKTDARIAFAFKQGPTGNTDLDSFISKIGASPLSLRQRWDNFKQDLKARIIMASVDEFHGINRAGQLAGLTASDSGYMDARMSGNAAELTQTIIEHGPPVWNDGAPDIAPGMGLLDILKPLGGNVNLWLTYMTALRADRLMSEARENLFTRAEIDAALDLGRQHPEFNVARDQYNQLQKQVLDFAQASGVINPQTRALWDHGDYIPFHRIIEGGQVKASANGGGGIGFVRNQIKKLTGGQQKIGDPLENIVRNWLALMDASLKANAGRTTIDALNGTGLVTPHTNAAPMPPVVPYALARKFLDQNPQLAQAFSAIGLDPTRLPPAAFAGLQQMMAQTAPVEDDVISVWRNGKREHWKVHDPLLMRSLGNLNPSAWKPIIKLLTYPKRIVTKGITLTPQFMLKNFWRDIWHVFVQGAKIGNAKVVVLPTDSLKGLVSALKNDDTAKSLLAAGGSFTEGYVNAGDTEGAAHVVRRSVKQGRPSGMILSTPTAVWRFYRHLQSAAENANRVAMYNKSRAKGLSRKESAFAARDLLDFSMRGDNPILQLIVMSTPFMNARLQGLYRLGVGMKQNFLSVAARGMLIALASVLLLARNWDDDRYKALTNEQKANYWHFFDVFAKGDHFQLPKPFEVGSIFGSIPEAIGDAMLTNSEEPDATLQSAKFVGYVFGQTLNLSPQPQAVWPLLELAMNKNTFTEAPIINQGDENVLPEDQTGPNTSPTYDALAKSMPDVAPEFLRSPKQLEHLGRGYLGNVQDYVLLVSDQLVRQGRGEATPPERASQDLPGIRDFYKTGPARNTKHLTEMYNLAKEAAQVTASIKRNEDAETDTGDKRVEELERDNSQLLDVADDFKEAAKNVGDLRKEQRQIQLDPDMTPEAKREEIDAIQNDINDIAKDVYDLRPGGKLNPETAGELLVAPPTARATILRNNNMPATAALLESFG